MAAPASAQESPARSSGPILLVTAGAGSFEYRDVLITTEPASWVGGAVTFRGFTASVHATRDLNFKKPRTIEALAAYSYAAPFVDLSAGVVTCQTREAGELCWHAFRVTGITNRFRRLAVGAVFDKSFEHNRTSLNVFAGIRLYGDARNAVDLRVSRTDWRGRSERANGTSLRLLLRNDLGHGLFVHGLAGIIVSNHGSIEHEQPLASLSVSWTR